VKLHISARDDLLSIEHSHPRMRVKLTADTPSMLGQIRDALTVKLGVPAAEEVLVQAWAPKEQRWFCLNELLQRARADIQQRKQQQQGKENVRPGFAAAVEGRSGTADGEQKQSGDEVEEGGKKAPTEVRGARKQHSLRTVLKHAFKSCRDLHRRPRTSTATGKRPLSSSPPPQSSPSSSLCVCAIEVRICRAEHFHLLNDNNPPHSWRG
jgi:hypothetical protein